METLIYLSNTDKKDLQLLINNLKFKSVQALSASSVQCRIKDRIDLYLTFDKDIENSFKKGVHETCQRILGWLYEKQNIISQGRSESEMVFYYSETEDEVFIENIITEVEEITKTVR